MIKMNKKQTAITVPIVAVLLVALAFFVFPLETWFRRKQNLNAQPTPLWLGFHLPKVWGALPQVDTRTHM